MDQSGKVANPARGQLNTENEYFPDPVRAQEFGLARRIWPPRPVSAYYSFSIFKVNLVLTYVRDSSRFSRRRPFIINLNRHTPSGQSRVYRVTQLRTDGVHFRESAGTGSGVLQVIQVTDTALASPWTNSCAPLFPHTHYYWYEVGMLKLSALLQQQYIK